MKNLNFLNKVFVIKKPYSKKKERQFVYFSNGYRMIWSQTDFYIVKVDNAIDIFQFENGIANHEQLNDRVFLENAIRKKYYNDIGHGEAAIKYSNNIDLINDFIRSGYTYISPLEYQRLDKNLLKIIEFQVNRLDKGEKLIGDNDEYLKLI